MDLAAYLDAARGFGERFRARWEPYPTAPAAEVDGERLAAAWAEYTERLQDNYPFFHPRFAGQMLKPPHPVAVAAYLAAMCVNPNNHALDGRPVTSEMEKEAAAELGAMWSEEHTSELQSRQYLVCRLLVEKNSHSAAR